jgi:DNA-binding IclR family transcriptional regulator
LLAHLPLPTRRTASTEAELKERLDAAAADGFAIDDQEFMEGMVASAVPVRGDGTRLLAAIAVNAPTAWQSVGGLRGLLPRLHAAAAAIADLTVEEAKSREPEFSVSDRENLG